MIDIFYFIGQMLAKIIGLLDLVKISSHFSILDLIFSVIIVIILMKIFGGKK